MIYDHQIALNHESIILSGILDVIIDLVIDCIIPDVHMPRKVSDENNFEKIIHYRGLDASASERRPVNPPPPTIIEFTRWWYVNSVVVIVRRIRSVNDF